MPTTVPQPPQVGTGDAGSPPGTAAPPGGSFDYSQILSLLFGPASGGGSLAGLGTFAGLGALGMYEANQAQNQNQATIGPITNVGQPIVDAGTGLMKQFQSGTLKPAAQNVVSTSATQGANLVNAATPIGQIAQGLFTQYQSGNLKPADQLQLDQQTAAAKAQVLQALGPNADSTMRATYFQQIDDQAAITKQKILDGYLATGNTQFDEWAKTTETGQQLILDGQKYAVTQLDTTFQQALEASSLGGSDILAGIKLAVDSNTEIANALQSYMGNLAKAYALSKASGGGGGASAAGSAVGNLLSKAGGALKNLFSGGTDTAGAGLTAMTPGDISAGAGGFSDAAMQADIANAPLGSDVTALFGGGDVGAASVGADSLGGGAAISAGSDLGAAGAAGGAADAAGGGATAAAGGGDLGAIGSLGAIGLAALPALYGASQPPVKLNKDYWDRLTPAVASGDSGAQMELAQLIMQGGMSVPYSQQQLDAWGVTQLIQQLQSAASSGAAGGSRGGGAGGTSLSMQPK